MADSTLQPDNSVRLNKLVQASPQQVYDTWLDASSYAKWFTPAPEAQCTEACIDPTVGGKFRIVIGTPGGDHVGFGQFLELVPGKRIAMTWSWESEDGYAANTTLTLDLYATDNPHGDGPATEIVLTHAGLESAASRSDHTGGWWGCLKAIGFFVRGVDPREAMYGQSAERA